MSAGLSHIVLYVKDVEAAARFYTDLFGYRRFQMPDDRILELVPQGNGARLMLHKAAKTAKQGQAQAKLAFRVEDVHAFCSHAAAIGHAFGTIHDGGGYEFSNTKDPAGNSVQVTSRPLRDP